MDSLALPELAKYVLWVLSTGLAFVGAWFFKFTRENPTDPDRLKLTRAGKVALWVATSSFVLGFALQVYQDRDAREKGEVAKQFQTKQQQQITQLNASVDKMLQAFLGSPETTEEFAQLDLTKRRAIAELRKDPVVRQRVAEPTLQALAALGIRNPDDTLDAAPAPVLAGLQGEILIREAYSGHLAEVQQLLDTGVPVDYRKNATEVTPLIFAVQGADETKQSDPPSHVAVVDLLLKRGADPNARYGPSPMNQSSAIQFASKHPEITRQLLNAGADINVSGGMGFTPLMGAAIDGNTNTVELLLARGARTETQNAQGETVCEFAKRGKKPQQVLAVLRAKGICDR